MSARGVARWLALVALSLYAAYFVIANLVLASSLGRKAVSSERARVDYAWGYTLLPTRLHLRGLSVVVDGERVRWTTTADEVVVVVALDSLGGTLHARRVRASGIEVIGRDAASGDLQTKRDEADRGPSPPAIARVRPTQSGSGETRWSLRVDDLELVGVRAVTIGQVSWRGSARAGGALRFHPERGALFEPLRADISSGDVLVATDPLLVNVRGHVELTRQLIRTDRASLTTLLDDLNGVVELGAAVPGERSAQDRSAIAEAIGPGSARAHLRIDGGVLAPGSSASIDLSGTRLGREPLVQLGGSLSLRAERDEVIVDGVLRDIAVRRSSDGAIVDVPEARVDARSPRVRLSAPLEEAIVQVEAPALSIDLGAVPGIQQLFEGAAVAHGNGRLVIEESTARGTLSVRAERATVRLGDHQLEGALDLEAELEQWRVGDDGVRVRARAAHGGAPPDGTWLRLEDGVLDHAAGTFDGRATVRMPTARPALDALTGSKKLPEVITLLATTRPLEAAAHLRIAHGEIALRDIDATAGLVGLRGRYTIGEGPPTGTLLLETGPFATGIAISGGQTDVVLASARSWFEKSLAETPR